MIDLQEIERQSRIAAIEICDASGIKEDLYRLYFTEGYSQEEIAEMKGVSQNTVSKKLRRIKKQLTEMCRKLYVFPLYEMEDGYKAFFICF